MGKRILAVLVITIFVVGFVTGCGSKDQKANTDDVVIGDMEFEVINPNELEDGDVKDWYSEKYMEEGFYTKNTDDVKYILLAAGVQSTGGYSIEIISVEGKENEIVVDGKLNAPEEGEIVTQALTYPSALIKVEDISREAFKGNFEKPAVEVNNDLNDALEDLETVTGVYSGQIDANSIEMKIDNNHKAFRLSDEGKITIAEDKIKIGDVITVNYIENEHGQLIIQEIFMEPGYQLNK